MAVIFISYRRSDSSGFALLLHKHLAARFGEKNVFIDVDGLEPGVDFVAVLEEKMAASDVVIALIGREWQAARLADPYDFVRLELEMARAKGKRIIPALVEGASMPAAQDIPKSMEWLLRRQAFFLSNTHFDRDADALVQALERIQEDTGRITVVAPRPRAVPVKKPFPAARALMVAAAAIVAAGLAWRFGVASTPAAVRQDFRMPRNDRGDRLTYLWIPAGSFTMGCSPQDDECDATFEQPSHPVTLTKGFWLSQTEVTQKAYREVTGNNPSHFHGDDLPVEQVRWEDAAAYCAKIGGRLPTEAEWEYAARGRTVGARYGSVLEIAWFADNSGRKQFPAIQLWQAGKLEKFVQALEENQNRSQPVAQKLQNDFGLHDMLGNVHEWVADFYEPYKQSAQTNPFVKGPTGFRMARGGAWSLPRWYSRASHRGRVFVNKADSDLGFRCAADWQ